MTYHTASSAFACEGTSALEARPHLVLLEGGRAACVPPAPARQPEVPRATPLTWEQRAAAALVALGVVAALVLASAAGDAWARSQTAETLASLPTETISVSEGDTLWEIASERAAEGVGTRELVRWIEEANGLQGAELSVGQRLVVPASPVAS